MQTHSSRLQGTGLLPAQQRESQPQACICTHPNTATAAPVPVMRKCTSDGRQYRTPWKARSPICFSFPLKKCPVSSDSKFTSKNTPFLLYTSRRRTYVTNAIAIFRRCLSFSFTEPAAKLPFTWQLLMKSERFCKLVLGCFHFPINCPPAIIRFKLVIVSLFPFSL